VNLTEQAMSFDPKLLYGILVCSKSKSPLVREGDFLICVDRECRLQFAIRDGIPNMLADEATKLTPTDWSAVMQRQGREPIAS
jgi:uncharacterized protein YbaR (Trm112 family)